MGILQRLGCGIGYGLVAGFAGAGLITLFLGLIVTLPLIGHATWHAYRDLVEHVS